MVRIRRRSTSLMVLAFTLGIVVGVLVAPAIAMAGNLSGIHGVLWDHDSVAVAGARVDLYLKGVPPTPVETTVTAESGTFSFHPASGTYWLRFSDPQQRYSTYWYLDALRSYLPDTPTDIVVDDVFFESRIYPLKHGVALHVHVVRPGLQPVENVQVSAVRSMPVGDPWAWDQLTTDASGECTFTNMPEGQWYATAFDQHPNSSPAWYTSGWYPTSSYVGFAAGESHDETITVKMLPKVTAQVVGLSDTTTWTQSPTGVATLDLGMDSDYNPCTLFYRVYPQGGTAPFPWPEWDGSTQPTVAVTEGAYRFEAFGQVDTPPLEDPIGQGLTLDKTFGIDNTPPHTTANVGTVSQSTLVLTHDDDGLSPITPWYALDGGAPTEYVMPVPLSRGVHSVTWHSRDAAGNIETAHSGTIISGPQANVRRPVSRSSMTHGRYLSVSGTLSRARNHSRLTVLAYRWDGVTWVLSRTKSVRIHTPRRGLSRYSGSIKLSTRGSWKIVSRYEGDGSWVQSYSPPRYVKVK
jgi:hypothetical protein